MDRPVAGTVGEPLAAVRNPGRLFELLRSFGVAVPSWSRHPQLGDWLTKPLRGSGGRGIRHSDNTPAGRGFFHQQFVRGQPVSAVFVGLGDEARLVGLMRQLVGQRWLHAGEFAYCGSVGRLPETQCFQAAWQNVGRALTAGAGLRGVFGVDCIVTEGWPVVVEVNPRYTASVEALELILGEPILTGHIRAFRMEQPINRPVHGAFRVIGKAVYFAPSRVQFPESGPWDDDLQRPVNVWQVPQFADVPTPGEVIAAGDPVLTFFCHGSTERQCLHRLRRRAGELDALFASSR